jgi:hypothetical protein
MALENDATAASLSPLADIATDVNRPSDDTPGILFDVQVIPALVETQITFHCDPTLLNAASLLPSAEAAIGPPAKFVAPVSIQVWANAKSATSSVAASSRSGLMIFRSGLRVLVSWRFEPVEAAAVGLRERDLILQVGEIEHGRVRHVRPRNQVGTLLQHEIRGRNEPRESEVAV